MTQTPTPVTADFCSFDEYKKIEGTKRTIGFCNNDVTAPSDFSDSGYVEIKETGIYTFLIESDDGATLNVSGNSVKIKKTMLAYSARIKKSFRKRLLRGNRNNRNCK